VTENEMWEALRVEKVRWQEEALALRARLAAAQKALHAAHQTYAEVTQNHHADEVEAVGATAAALLASFDEMLAALEIMKGKT
jgi:hypothetical protein